jgi:uncharacterized damage-inducible protein DinB
MKEQLLEHLAKSRAYTLELAGLMPEGSYSFRPSEETRSFAEQLHHIAYTLGWMEQVYVRNQKVDWAPPTADGLNKKSVIQYINEEYDKINRSIESQPSFSNALVLAYSAILDHVTHHRGQALIGLRMTGISAPEYRY